MWPLIWVCLDDIDLGPDGVSFFKVKAHAPSSYIAAAEAPEQRILIANGRADELARRGALLGVNEFLKNLDQTVTVEAELVKCAQDHIADMAITLLKSGAGWPDATLPPKVVPREPSSQAAVLKPRLQSWAEPTNGFLMLSLHKVFEICAHARAEEEAGQKSL